MRFLLLVVLLLILSGCDAQRSADWSKWERGNHLGYVFAIPPDYTLEVSENVIAFRLDHYRRPFIIEVQVAAKKPIELPSGSPVKEGTDPAKYVIHDVGGGSGGTEYILSTAKMVRGERLTITALIQAEWGTPNFAHAWAIWESLEALE